MTRCSAPTRSRATLDLLDAFAPLPHDLATLHLVGRTDVDWCHGVRVARRLARPDVAERVVVHGPVSRERLADLYGSADVFVLPSYREPYGTVYGEAMAAGLPAVGWRAGNLPHVADTGARPSSSIPGTARASPPPSSAWPDPP
jgi:glycosyltransferase involved in cell wall biosynthesis